MGFFRRRGAQVGPGGERERRNFRRGGHFRSPQAVADHQRFHRGLKPDHLKGLAARGGDQLNVLRIGPGIRSGFRGRPLPEGFDAGVQFADERFALLRQRRRRGKGGERGFEEGPFLLQQSPDAPAELKVVTEWLEGSGHEVGEASARGDGTGGGVSTAPWLSSCHCVVARERHCR